jgi:FkbM family methyltransferase
MRTLLERLSRGKVLRRRLPDRLGADPVYVSPDAALTFWRCDLDAISRDLFDFAEEFVKQGDVVWDVGACAGPFTFASAFRAGSTGHVVTVEADTFQVGLLRRSAASRSAGRAKVTILPAAASDSVGVAEFQVSKRGRSTSHLASSKGSSQTGGVRETVSVVTVSLDWLAERLPPPRVLKIDVEGAEAAVLAGGQRLVSQAKPVVLCEVAGENAEVCTQFFKSHGYSLYDFDNRRRGEIDKAAWNTLAIPAGAPRPHWELWRRTAEEAASVRE